MEKRIHIEIKRDTLAKLLEIKAIEQEKEYYHVTNDIVVRKLIECYEANKKAV